MVSDATMFGVGVAPAAASLTLINGSRAAAACSSGDIRSWPPRTTTSPSRTVDVHSCSGPGRPTPPGSSPQAPSLATSHCSLVGRLAWIARVGVEYLDRDPGLDLDVL